VSDVADGLVAVLRAWPALAAVPVLDGLDPTSWESPDFVAVAASDDEEGETLEFDADWSDIAGGHDESGEVTVTVVSQRGDPASTSGVVRRAAAALAGHVADAVHAARGDIGVPGVMWAHVTSGRFTQLAGEAGQACTIRLTISYRGRFGP
jgi:hypothetical protein